MFYDEHDDLFGELYEDIDAMRDILMEEIDSLEPSQNIETDIIPKQDNPRKNFFINFLDDEVGVGHEYCLN
jgi:hypothetical protein